VGKTQPYKGYVLHIVSWSSSLNKAPLPMN